MNKRGFTLIELLGVIILITLVSFLVFPTILNKIKESTTTIDSATKKLLINSAKLYISDNINEYSDDYSYEACIKINDLIEEDYIEKDIIDNYSTDIKDKSIKVTYTSSYNYTIVNSENCKYSEDIIDGAEPELNGLTPVIYNGSTWVVADTTKPWYSYSKKKWANAVLLYNNVKKETGDAIDITTDVIAMYVWIPRYRYAIPTGTNGVAREINIAFENKSTAKTAGTGSGSSFLTHPAFTFGNVEVNGIWVGKFETSGGATPVILPNQNSSTAAGTIATQFEQSKKFNDYGLKNIDAHMMKNSDWGAVAYLSNSMYGINEEIRINNTMPVVTGCAATTHDELGSSSICQNPYNTEIGVLASTTGNIYGIYDMNGGNYESVMANYNSQVGQSEFSSTFFTNTENNKYYDKIVLGTDGKCNASSCNGGAANETSGWYNDLYSLEFSEEKTFINRGGHSLVSSKAGIFSINAYEGVSSSLVTYRSVIVPLS